MECAEKDAGPKRDTKTWRTGAKKGQSMFQKKYDPAILFLKKVWGKSSTGEEASGGSPNVKR